MILGIFLRYFKTYQGTNFIPLTEGEKFSGLLGDNGIGKSSVLEALDCFFNDKKWNLNAKVKKVGKLSKPHIVPLFLIERKKISEKNYEKAMLLHNATLSFALDDMQSKHRKSHTDFILSVKEKIDESMYFLLPIGVEHNENVCLSSFNSRPLVSLVKGETHEQNVLTEKELDEFRPLLDELWQYFEYIHIPKEIDTEVFTKLETSEIQKLMGDTLQDILETRVPPEQIKKINDSLNEFIDSIGQDLGEYTYKSSIYRQRQLRKNEVYDLIVRSFFNVRKLFKRIGGKDWVEISDLSSGEKQKAIIDVAHKLLLRNGKQGKKLIIGIDEPESSLHMSACYAQFDELYSMSKSCMQLLFSSHWYGFLPTIESGSITVISKSENRHVFDRINLHNYREQIKQIKGASKKRLPYDMRLKSINDFVQSIITSSIGENPFNWLICEGSSEKIYFSRYFSREIDNGRLRVVPVGGAKEIKRLYSHLATAFEDFKDEIKGNIVLLSDTDAQLVTYDIKQFNNLHCKRIVNCEKDKTTKLVNVDANPVSPRTEIEHALNGVVYLEALKSLIDHDEHALSFLHSVNASSEKDSFFSLDLKNSQMEMIDQFLKSGDNKVKVAKKYVQLLNTDHEEPRWIGIVRQWLAQTDSRVR